MIRLQIKEMALSLPMVGFLLYQAGNIYFIITSSWYLLTWWMVVVASPVKQKSNRKNGSSSENGLFGFDSDEDDSYSLKKPASLLE